MRLWFFYLWLPEAIVYHIIIMLDFVSVSRRVGVRLCEAKVFKDTDNGANA